MTETNGNTGLIVTLTTAMGTTLNRQHCADGQHAAREAAAMILRRGELAAGDMLTVRFANRHDTAQLPAVSRSSHYS